MDYMGGDFLSADDAINALRVLEKNGFRNPVVWLRHREIRSFRAVSANPISWCPDCGSPPAPGKTLGQYVYYSTLLRLKPCRRCGLIWADVKIDTKVISAHFESAYKDVPYFEASRGPIFDQLVRQISRVTPFKGSVLDVGGGMGHLMARLLKYRPDVSVTVLDLSAGSIQYAREHFGLEGFCGTLEDLPESRYDTVVCSDVLYYVENMSTCWIALQRITKGALVIRVPDKLTTIRVCHWLRSHFYPSHTQDRITAFNPEHRFILTRRYLRDTLERLGFDDVRIVPAAILRPKGWLKRSITFVMTLWSWLVRRAPAMVVIAKRSRP